jgi:ABC-type branched-subunit amino acid transport system substrate-binding protein
MRSMIGPLVSLTLVVPPGCQPAPSAPVAGVTEGRGDDPDHASPSGGTPANGLSPQQGRGKQIYLRGTSPGGRSITAVLGQSRDAVSAALVTCGNCHGLDGRGRPEGGIEPPNLTWAALRRANRTEGRRNRPAYTTSLVGRAITMGLDSSGAPLGLGMPCYQLSPEDLSDLIAYLEVLGTEPDPGVSPSALRIGTLLPPEEVAPELRETLIRTLGAFTDNINRRNGVYNRKFELVFEELAISGQSPRQALASFLERRRIFALVAPYIAGQDEGLLRAAGEEGVPVIGPLTPQGYADPSPNGQVFYLHSGLGAQARALAISALGRPAPRATAILRDDDPASACAADAVADRWIRGGWVEPERVVVRAEESEANLERLAARLNARDTDVLVYLGPASLIRPLLDAAGRASWQPTLYLPGALSDRRVLDLPPSFDRRIFLAFPYLPGDLSRSGHDELEYLRKNHGLSQDHQATQMTILTAFRVLEEGLRRCGRDVTRARFVEELERLDEFSTGYSRPLTFGPNRRVGSLGAHILAVEIPERRLRPLGWTSVSEFP